MTDDQIKALVLLAHDRGRYSLAQELEKEIELASTVDAERLRQFLRGKHDGLFVRSVSGADGARLAAIGDVVLTDDEHSAVGETLHVAMGGRPYLNVQSAGHAS